MGEIEATFPGGAHMVAALEIGRARAHPEVSDKDAAYELLAQLCAAGYVIELGPADA